MSRCCAVADVGTEVRSKEAGRDDGMDTDEREGGRGVAKMGWGHASII